jgi:hypothetical protein
VTKGITRAVLFHLHILNNHRISLLSHARMFLQLKSQACCIDLVPAPYNYGSQGECILKRDSDTTLYSNIQALHDSVAEAKYKACCCNVSQVANMPAHYRTRDCRCRRTRRPGACCRPRSSRFSRRYSDSSDKRGC